MCWTTRTRQEVGLQEQANRLDYKNKTESKTKVLDYKNKNEVELKQKRPPTRVGHGLDGRKALRGWRECVYCIQLRVNEGCFGGKQADGLFVLD